ncbi:MAG: carboxypeptidase-like regulatory domain-containing protein [Syntrophothermus sp.]
MNISFQRWFRMSVLTDEKLDQNSELVNRIPGMKDYQNDLKAVLAEIRKLDQQFELSLKGLTLDKQIQKKIVIDCILELSSKATGYAHNKKNLTLEKKVYYKPSDFSNCKDEELLARGRNLLDITLEYGNEMTSFDVTNEKRERLATLLDQYEKISSQPALGRKDRKSTYRQMDECFKKLRDIMTGLDISVEMVRKSESEFYNSFKEVRKLGSSQSSNVNLAGRILEADTKKPVHNVKITLTNGDPEHKNMEISVNNHSGFRIKNLSSGIYVFTATKPGYKELTLPVTIISNERLYKEVFLEKE